MYRSTRVLSIQVGLEVRYEGMQYPILIASTRVREIRGISLTNSDGIPYEEDGIFIGGATPIHEIQHALARMDGRVGPTAAGKEPGSGSVAGAFVDMLRWFGSAQIRNVASLAGKLELLGYHIYSRALWLLREKKKTVVTGDFSCKRGWYPEHNVVLFVGRAPEIFYSGARCNGRKEGRRLESAFFDNRRAGFDRSTRGV